MKNTEFGCLPTAIGSMPHTEPQAACAQVLQHLKDIPCWPQLPGRSFQENMYVQFSEGFPGAVVTNNRIYIERAQGTDRPLETLYAAYLENDVNSYAISPDYAAGLHTFLNLENITPLAVKGQVTGPISWGLTVTDQNQRAIIYDDTLADAAARLLRLKAAWQEKKMREVCPNTIMFVDEPYLVSLGSAFVSISREKVLNLLGETLGGISGLKGIHCCGNTDWSVVLATGLDILSFDAYNYAQSLNLYPAEVKAFLSKGGAIAWGIVPNDTASLAKESAASLKDRLEEAMAPFTRNGTSFKQLIAHGLLTPSCGLEPLGTVAASARALELLAELSADLRKSYL